MADITKEVIQTIQDAVKVQSIAVDGKDYLSRNIYLPPAEPVPAPITVATLSGLVDFINSAGETELKDFRAVQVVDHRTVNLLGNIAGRHKQRPVFVAAQVPSVNGLVKFGQWHEQEEFMIWLQGAFVQEDQVKNLLRIIGTIQSDAVRVSADDGVSQRVTTKRGIFLANEETLPNPVTLQPFRTFPDIDQPFVRFVLRVDCDPGESPRLLLAETGDVGWMADRAAAVKAFLRQRIDADLPIIG